MLMQAFKSAADLKITEPEQQALIKVLGMLERGDLKNGTEYDRGDLLFNMGTQGHGCGTAACIGGWVAHLIGEESQYEYVNNYQARELRHFGLHNLYWGRTSPATTTAQAATALRSYLTTGDARWDLAVAL